MSSSNPFRKATAQPPVPSEQNFAFDASSVPRASQPPPPVSFRHSSSSTSPEPEAPGPGVTEAQPKKKKVVKKVRVLSPPPLSPDSPEWPDNKPWQQPQLAPGQTLQGAVVGEEDPFGGSDSTPADSGRGMPQLGNYDAWNSQPGGASQMFKGQMEADMKAKEGEALKIGNGNATGKGMDVSAFQRLLMTGNKGDGSLDGAQDQPQPPSSNAQRSEEEAQADDDLSDSSMTVQFGQRKKAPPPPPSSRHGRSINAAEPSEETSQKPTTATDSSKRSAPAPPPPRGHSRTESKATGKDDGPPSPTRPHSNRHSTYAPAPPPPRRPHATARSQTSPTTITIPNDTSTPNPQEASSDIDPPVPKISAPPPPPARNTSVRRPPSVSSVEAPSRQVSSDSTGKKPPPPPARKRGSSKGSMDVPRTMGAEGEQQGDGQGQGQSILSDLEALQREVDALRGKMG